LTPFAGNVILTANKGSPKATGTSFGDCSGYIGVITSAKELRRFTKLYSVRSVQTSRAFLFSRLRDLPHRRPRFRCQCLRLADYCREHSMNSHFQATPDTNMVQLPMGLKPPVQPFHGYPTVIDHLPLGSLVGLGCQPLVPRIRVDDRRRMVLVLDVHPKLLTGIPCIANPILRLELAPCVPSLLRERCLTGRGAWHNLTR